MESDEQFVADMEWLHSHDREAALPPEKLARLFALARRGAAADAEIERLRAALRPFACECVGFCKDAKHNYGEIEPIDTCKYGRNRAALGEERT